MSERIEKLTKEHAGLARYFQVSPDSYSHYENYLKFTAIDDQQNGRGTTHLFICEDDVSGEQEIRGFITLRASSLNKKYADYIEGHSALEIAELAVDRRYQRRGIGSALINFALSKAVELNEEHIGVEYIILCSDPEAVEFYRKTDLGFADLRDFYDIPREGWNRNCTPLYAKIDYSA